MKRCFISLFVLLLVSCAEKVIKPPENLIAKETMTNILYDLALINAAKSTNPKILEDHKIDPMEYVFNKYGIDSLQFVKSDVYYASMPVEYGIIYENVSARLEKNRKQIEDTRKKKKEENQLKLDRDTANTRKGEIKKIVRDTIP